MGRLVTGKGQLAVILSGLKGFEKPKVRQEQYITEPEIAADILWKAYMLGDIEKKDVADLGAGPGSLGIGALLLGASKAYFVENDKNALEIAKKNFAKVKSEGLIAGNMAEFRLMDVKSFKERINTVFQNPPFGVKSRGADRKFLEKAAEIAEMVYSIHKSETEGFVVKFMSSKGFKLTHIWKYSLGLKATLKYHIRRIKRIRVSCFRFSLIK